MGYSHITDLNLSPFNNTKPNNSPLTLIPTSATSPCHGCPDFNNLLSLNHGDLASNANERSDSSEQLALGSSRWNPTPEQLHALEELYRRGTRTPSAAQIQQIAMRLQRFGKIEGKNVFYWFQNHKARERQKRRRQRPQQYCETTDQSSENKDSGSVSEIQQPKNKGPPPNFSEPSEKFISKHGNEIAAAKSEPNEWIQIQEELQLIKSRVGRANSLDLCSSVQIQENIITNLEDENREEQTLELFPLRSNGGINISKKDTAQVPITAINTTFTTPNHRYFEFLPLK